MAISYHIEFLTKKNRTEGKILYFKKCNRICKYKNAPFLVGKGPNYTYKYKTYFSPKKKIRTFLLTFFIFYFIK